MSVMRQTLYLFYTVCGRLRGPRGVHAHTTRHDATRTRRVTARQTAAKTYEIAVRCPISH